MKALCWHGKSDMRYETVPDPKIQDPRDAMAPAAMAIAMRSGTVSMAMTRPAPNRNALRIAN